MNKRRVATSERFYDSLEDRRLLTTTVYIDYGDLFAGGSLVTTVGALDSTVSGANPDIDGPVLIDATNTNYAAATSVTINSVDSLFGAGAAAFRTRLTALAQRFFEPFDITVVELTSAFQNVNGFNVRAASSLAEISQTLGVNEGVAENNDSYVIVGQYLIGASNDNPATFAMNGYGGLATGTNIGGNNNNDGTSFVLLVGAGDGANFNGNQIAHEAGHVLGLQHAYRQDTSVGPPAVLGATGPQYDMLHSSEIMSYLGYVSQGGFNFFSRYPMMDGDGNTNVNQLVSNPTPYDQYRNDPNIGAGSFEYVTGTGAHDIITITKTGANSANVSVQAFFDAGYTTAIDAPGPTGTTYSYSIALDRPLTIDAGGNNDRIVLDADLGITIRVRGMHGTDQLVVMGKNAPTGTYTPGVNTANGFDGNADRRGTIVVGATTINLLEFDLASKISVQDFGTFTLRTPLNSDILTIGSMVAGTNRISGNTGGRSIIPLEFKNVTTFVLDSAANDGAAGNDVINLNSALVAAGLKNMTIRTGSSNDTDRLNINVGNIGLPVAGGTFRFEGGTGGLDTLFFATAGPNSVIYTPDGFNDPSRGSLAFGGSNMLFTGLEFVNPVSPVILGFAISSMDVFEGDTVTLTGTFQDPGSLSSHSVNVNWGDGTAATMHPLAVGARSFSIDYAYLDDNPTGTPFDVNNVQFTLVDNNNLVDSDTTSVIVRNLDPVLSGFMSDATFENKGKEGEPVNIQASFTDVGILDTHTAQVDWGDGSSIEFVTVNQGAGIGSIDGSHVYASGGVYTVTMTLTDDDTGDAQSSTLAVITGVGVNFGVLYVVGTSERDVVSINSFGNGEIRVHTNFTPEKYRTFSGADVDKIIAYLCEGDDHMTISGRVNVPAILHGGGGDDFLSGGSGPTVLLGDGGNDRLIGNIGNSLLIGGTGMDRLVGGRNDDALIGGTTNIDHDDNALMGAIMAWSANDTYENRISALTGLLTVTDDGDVDTINGSSGQDLFFSGLGDELLDVGSFETVL